MAQVAGSRGIPIAASIMRANVQVIGTVGIPPLRVGTTKGRFFPQPVNPCPDTNLVLKQAQLILSF